MIARASQPINWSDWNTGNCPDVGLVSFRCGVIGLPPFCNLSVNTIKTLNDISTTFFVVFWSWKRVSLLI